VCQKNNSNAIYHRVSIAAILAVKSMYYDHLRVPIQKRPDYKPPHCRCIVDASKVGIACKKIFKSLFPGIEKMTHREIKDQRSKISSNPPITLNKIDIINFRKVSKTGKRQDALK